MGIQRILVVDDDKLFRWSLQQSLTREGYEVITRETGEEAIKEAISTRFDLVIADYKMPGMSGLAVLDQIRERYPGTKVILITAYGNADLREKALQMGASMYIDKPLKLGELKDMIKILV